ncbi:MAG: fructosamine kinase family protein [Aquirufa sp.]
MSQQSQEQYQFIERILQIHLGQFDKIDEFEFFYGGNFNLAVRVKLKKEEFFIKWNQGEHPGHFEAEAKNLQLIHSTNTISVPKVIGVGKLDEKEYLMMECIPSIPKVENYWADFGEKLAALHHSSHPNGHGLDYNNFIGATIQINDWNPNGVAFFLENRLQKQVEKAVYDRKIDKSLVDKFEQIFQKIPTIIPNEKSALIHGDLWSGNAMVNQLGLVTLVDPSCYYGLREAELAFTTMFGGFEKQFYEAYHTNFKIEKGFHERIPLYNLYPLMVHVNSFGEGYLDTVKKILDTYL